MKYSNCIFSFNRLLGLIKAIKHSLDGRGIFCELFDAKVFRFVVCKTKIVFRRKNAPSVKAMFDELGQEKA